MGIIETRVSGTFYSLGENGGFAPLAPIVREVSSPQDSFVAYGKPALTLLISTVVLGVAGVWGARTGALRSKLFGKRFKVKITEPLENIFHVNFGVEKDLSRTFLRFQEHYESPHFRGKFFTLDEFREWYIKNSPGGKKTGKFTYHSDWGGFNIPSSILEPFYEGKFSPLSTREKALLDFCAPRRGKGPFYIIGTYGKNNPETVKHEVMHGLFYTRPGYKAAVLKILDDLPGRIRQQIRGVLKDYGYHPSVFDDETQAYILTCAEDLTEAGVDMNKLAPIVARLETNFSQFRNGILV